MNDNYWNFKYAHYYVHYAIEGLQSAQELKIACNICLSTWASPNLPWKQSGNQYGTESSPEKDLGYSFSTEQVSCPDCLKWMEEELCLCPNCKEELAHGEYCSNSKCADHWWANEIICECGHPLDPDHYGQIDDIYICNGIANGWLEQGSCICVEYKETTREKQHKEKQHKEKQITAQQPTLWDRIKTFMR